MAKVSVIIPSYNHGIFLLDRLKTIYDQTYKDWEAIIIDDNSTDNSVEIISQFLDEFPDFRVSNFIVNKANSGSGYFSWQRGIELAKTEYIWIAETDDYSSPDFLKELYASLECNNAVLAFCDSIYVNQNKEFLYDSSNRTMDLEVSKNESKTIKGEIYVSKMPFQTYITNGSAVVFRKPKERIPDEIFLHKQCSDIFLWTYLLQKNNFVFVHKKLNFFRRHENSTSHIIQNKKLESIYHEKAYYLNYFNQLEKSQIFIEHYIKYYIYKNKFDFLNVSSLKKIKKKKVVQTYFAMLLSDVLKRIKLKLWKRPL